MSCWKSREKGLVTKEQRWDYIVSSRFINKSVLAPLISLLSLTYFILESFGLQNQIMLDCHLIRMAVDSHHNFNRRLCRRHLYSRKSVSLRSIRRCWASNSFSHQQMDLCDVHHPFIHLSWLWMVQGYRGHSQRQCRWIIPWSIGCDCSKYSCWQERSWVQEVSCFRGADKE